MKYVPTKDLWAGVSAWNQLPVPDSPWESGLTPGLLATGDADEIEAAIEDEEAAVLDCETFNYWVGEFERYVDRGKVPSTWSIDADFADGEWVVEDGFHRIAAARAVGIKLLPVG